MMPPTSTVRLTGLSTRIAPAVVTSIRPPFDAAMPHGVPASQIGTDRSILHGRVWIAFALYALLLLVGSQFGAGTTSNLLSATGAFAFLPLNLGGMYWLFRAAGNPLHGVKERRGLQLLGVMYICTAAGNLSWAIDTLRNLDPSYSTANLSYIASYLIGVVALAQFPLAPRGALEVRKFALDLACVTISIGALIWTFVIAPINWAGIDRTQLLFNLAYPASCILLLSMLCRLIMRQAGSVRYNDLAIIAVAIFAQCTIDLILELDYRNTVTALTGVAAAICPAMYIAVVYGAERLAVRTTGSLGQPRDPVINPTNLLPAVSAISVYVVLIWAAQSDRREPLGVLLTAAILLNMLFLAKQTMAARENAVLVQQRAEAETRARYEALAREGQKLEAVGRLAGGIAHDFNNLLTTVLANSEFALARLRPGAVGHDEVNDIHGAALRAAELVRQLLAFSRKSIIAPVVLQPDQVLREMERLLQRLAGDQCQLRLGLPTDLGTVRADRGQLEQAVANLVTNARDAMPAGGSIVISGANVVLDAAKAATLDVAPGEYIALSVQDCGTGIAPEIRSQIFEPFFSTKPRGKGTGLGLASTYGIMRQSHGAVEVETWVGEGSRFTLYLPRQADLVPQAVPVVLPSEDRVFVEPRPAQGETILLVEDEAGVRQVTRRMLEDEGYTVLTAPDARRARAMFDAHGDTIALLITDVVMPGKSGVDLARDIRTRWPDLTVLFISGYSDGDLPEEGVPAGELLQKPFTGAMLLTRVATTLRGRPPAPIAAHSR
jgi:signal transduction histidine kinase